MELKQIFLLSVFPLLPGWPFPVEKYTSNPKNMITIPVTRIRLSGPHVLSPLAYGGGAKAYSS